MASMNHILEQKIIRATHYWFEYHRRHTIDQYDSKAFLVDEMRKTFDQPHKPITYPRYLQSNMPLVPYEFNKLFYDIDGDLEILYNTFQRIANGLISHFNYAQTDKDRLRQHLRKISSMTNEYHLISTQRYKNIAYISDSFNNIDQVDHEFGSGLPCQILTNEGVVVLAFDSSKNLSPKASIESIDGNGMLGNYHVVRPDVLEDKSHMLPESMFYLSDDNPHDNPSDILDGRPDTWVEYQMVNITNTDKARYPGYDLSWAQGRRVGDKLRMRTVIKLNEPTNINWIHIDPYLPPAYNLSKITVHSINTSLDGISFEPIYPGRPILHTEIDLIVVSDPHVIPDHIYMNGFMGSKLVGQGVWNFPTRRAQYIEVVMDQAEAHDENIGVTRYSRISIKLDGTGQPVETKTQITQQEVSEEIRDGLPGKYPISETAYILKDVDSISGWRYCLGLRDVNIYSHTFAKSSEIITVPYKIDKEIQAIALEATERIPDEFVDDIALRNNWISYYISFDDVDWHPISPTHHRAITGHPIPPKVYTLNTQYYADPNEEPSYIETPEPVYQVRLKAVLNRPDDLLSFTPILEDYTLRIITKE